LVSLLACCIELGDVVNDISFRTQDLRPLTHVLGRHHCAICHRSVTSFAIAMRSRAFIFTRRLVPGFLRKVKCTSTSPKGILGVAGWHFKSTELMSKSGTRCNSIFTKRMTISYIVCIRLYLRVLKSLTRLYNHSAIHDGTLLREALGVAYKLVGSVLHLCNNDVHKRTTE
jgi:hypothetical protein